MSGERLRRMIEQELDRRGAAGQLRKRRVVKVLNATHVQSDGRIYVNFSGNNYLGLSHHEQVIAAAQAALREDGAGAGSSALVSGYSTAHASAERAIAQWKGSEAAVLLPSGYQAAHAAVQAIAGVGRFHRAGVRFLIDKLAHASLIDAIAGSHAPYRVYPHNNLGKLERLLREAPADQLQVVVTESIFSMDGDAADLAGLAELKERRRFVMLLDEAHGSGVYGPGGAGYAAEQGLQDSVDIGIVTLSKAIGAGGGAVCAGRSICEAVVNWGRAYIYSTSIAPALAAAAEAALNVMRDEPQRQERVRGLARLVRTRLEDGGLEIPAGDSPIIPVILGSESEALSASRRLMEAGLLAIAIRPPTVARGTSRLRITLCCEHTDDEIEALVDSLLALPR